MKRLKFTAIILALITLLSLPSCKAPDAAEQSLAYFTVFKSLYEENDGLNDDIKFIAVDLSQTKISDTSYLVELMGQYCEGKNLTLLQDTFEGLEEKEYISDLFFKEGILISFNDISLSNNRLKTSAKDWRGGTGAVGADYTVKLKNDSWQITKISGQWIS